MMNKKLGIAASIMGMTGVLIGAFGAHGLEDALTPDNLDTYETGVKYQIYHALLMLLLIVLPLSEKAKKTLFFLLVIGVVLFSGSIYGLATNVLTSFDFTTIGFVTPIGGSLLIIGWAVLLVQFIKYRR
ncbi:MAG: DUF423 domain-containing protein [Dokdonia sp.]|jgi:uncharacterized membrane protein YgdD (TMEM256/DUF423 family)